MRLRNKRKREKSTNNNRENIIDKKTERERTSKKYNGEKIKENITHAQEKKTTRRENKTQPNTTNTTNKKRGPRYERKRLVGKMTIDSEISAASCNVKTYSSTN